jgi:LmbE family N-acetylglucosaminyl deacetylase
MALAFSELMFYSRANVGTPTKLMIVAHPDDETIFGGEALLATAGWTVVSVTNAGNPLRRAEFMAAMTAAGANWFILDHPDHLTDGDFDPRLRQQLQWIIADARYESFVTHNARGEYGHPQHRSLHRIVEATIPREAPLSVFGHHWGLRATITDAKRTLLGHYPSQRSSILRTWLWASRERLRLLTR